MENNNRNGVLVLESLKRQFPWLANGLGSISQDISSSDTFNQANKFNFQPLFDQVLCYQFILLQDKEDLNSKKEISTNM